VSLPFHRGHNCAQAPHLVLKSAPSVWERFLRVALCFSSSLFFCSLARSASNKNTKKQVVVSYIIVNIMLCLIILLMLVSGITSFYLFFRHPHSLCLRLLSGWWAAPAVFWEWRVEDERGGPSWHKLPLVPLLFGSWNRPVQLWLTLWSLCFILVVIFALSLCFILIALCCLLSCCLFVYGFIPPL